MQVVVVLFSPTGTFFHESLEMAVTLLVAMQVGRALAGGRKAGYECTNQIICGTGLLESRCNENAVGSTGLWRGAL